MHDSARFARKRPAIGARKKGSRTAAHSIARFSGPSTGVIFPGRHTAHGAPRMIPASDVNRGLSFAKKLQESSSALRTARNISSSSAGATTADVANLDHRDAVIHVRVRAEHARAIESTLRVVEAHELSREPDSIDRPGSTACGRPSNSWGARGFDVKGLAPTKLFQSAGRVRRCQALLARRASRVQSRAFAPDAR